MDPKKAWRKESILALVLLLAYLLAAMGSSGRRDAAMAHFRDLASLEKQLGIFVELDLQRMLLGTPLIVLVNIFYFLVHSIIVLGFVLVLFLTGRQEYTRVRSLLVCFSLISFLVYWLYPVAPPRIMGEYGFVDTGDQTPGMDYETGFLSGLMNPYAAMPSVHMGYSLIVGGFLYLRSRGRLRMLGPIYPVLMLLVVTSSANHLFIDCIASVPLLLVAIFVVDRLDLPRRLARYLRR